MLLNFFAVISWRSSDVQYTYVTLPLTQRYKMRVDGISSDFFDSSKFTASRIRNDQSFCNVCPNQVSLCQEVDP